MPEKKQADWNMFRWIVDDASLVRKRPEPTPLVYGAICTFFLFAIVCLATAQWLRVDSLWGDGPRWIFECWRASQGELPYRDFSWQYPPLGLWIMALSFRFFGATFATTQVTIILLGAPILFLTWRLARKFLSEPLAVLCSLAALSPPLNTDRNIMSLMLYTPAYSINMASYLLFLLGCVGYLLEEAAHGQPMSNKRRWQIIVGTNLCLLSKPEGALIALIGLPLMAICDRAINFKNQAPGPWIRTYLLLGIASYIPATIIYAVYGQLIGLSYLIEGVTGYNQASISCPWWPTGFGMTVMVSHLLIFVVITLSVGFLSTVVLGPLVSDGSTTPRQNRAAVVAGVIFTTVLVLLILLIIVAALGLLNRWPLGGLLSAHLSRNPWVKLLLAPSKWLSLILLPSLAVCLMKRRFSGEGLVTATVWLLLCASTVILNLRGLFANHLLPVPEIVQLSVPLLGVLSMYATIRVLEVIWFRLSRNQADAESLRRRAVRITLGTFLAFVLLHTVQEGMSNFTKIYLPIETDAGRVMVGVAGTIAVEFASDAYISKATYQYIQEHTTQADRVLDLSYGGGINFAARRASGGYLTQYVFLKPKDATLLHDRDRVAELSPTIILSRDVPPEGVFGTAREVACPCPRLVWRATGWGAIKGKVFPALEFIKENYEVVDRITAAGTNYTVAVYRKKAARTER